VGGQHHAPAALPQGKTRYPLYKRQGGPHGQYGLCEKKTPPPGFDPRTIQPVAGRYTDWATQPTISRKEIHIWNKRKIGMSFDFVEEFNTADKAT
jgi:hypothetical protein